MLSGCKCESTYEHCWWFIASGGGGGGTCRSVTPLLSNERESPEEVEAEIRTGH